MTGSRSKIVHRPKPQDDPRQRRPDISKAQEVLKWSPRTPLKEGLKTTIAYFDELLKDQRRSRHVGQRRAKQRCVRRALERSEHSVPIRP